MCGRYTPLTENEVSAVRDIIRDISKRLLLDGLDGFDKSMKEVAPTNRVPVVANIGFNMEFIHAQFGFEKWDGKGVIINARSETVHEKPMFKRHVKNGRCVIPASGYYEWKQPEEGNKSKIKHLIKDKQGNLLFMAGLWREGKNGKEFVIITKDPVGEIVDIHDRMPVIIRSDQLEDWLCGAMPVEALASLNYDCVGEEVNKINPKKMNSSSNKQLTLFD